MEDCLRRGSRCTSCAVGCRSEKQWPTRICMNTAGEKRHVDSTAGARSAPKKQIVFQKLEHG
eukprot:4999538-Prymnesium_polylepis.1